MFASIEDFEFVYRNETNQTHKLFEALTDASLTQSVAKDHRTLGRMAWHIVVTYAEMPKMAGLNVTGVGEHEPMPKSASEIARVYRAVSDELLAEITKKWKDSDLQIEDNFYGMMWKRGLMLGILIRHEVHHRGQMTVLMRQAGLKVPGVYGPAKEEWAGMGMNPPEL